MIDPQSPGTLYVNGGGRLFKTFPELRPATVERIERPPHHGNSSAVDPRNSSTLYEANSYSALFKSTDGGLTWNPSDPLPCMGQTQFQPCLSLSFVIDPANPSTSLRGSRNGLLSQRRNVQEHGWRSHLEPSAVARPPSLPE